MRVVSFQTTVGANASNNNIFENKRTAKLPSGGRYRVTYCSAGSATGLFESVFVGGAQPVERSLVNIESAADRIVTQDDVVATFFAQGGEEVTAIVENTTAGALDHTARLLVEQVA